MQPKGNLCLKRIKNGLNNDDSVYDGDFRSSIIVLGDSHTESLQVEREVNFVSRLMQKLNQERLNSSVFNLGISGLSLADYISFADKYKATYEPDLLIIQVTESDFFTDATSPYKLVHIVNERGAYAIEVNQSYESRLKQILKGVYKPLNDIERIITLLPFLEYSKIKAEQLLKSQNTTHNTETLKKSNDIELLDWELKMLKEAYNIPIVLLYLPTTPVIKDGSVIQVKDHFMPVLSEIAKRYDVMIVNMEDVFNENYKLTKTLPRGFNNTSPGVGHLNETGHRLIAEELVKVIPALLLEGENAL